MKNLLYLEKYRQKKDELSCYGKYGNEYNGIFKVFVNSRSFYCIVSNGGEWDHVSIRCANQKRCPTWDEMCAIKDMFFEETETVLQYHPKKEDYVNIHRHVLHLWRPQKQCIPTPPIIMV